MKYNYSSGREEYCFDLESYIIDMDYGFSLKNDEIMYLCICSYNGCIIIMNPQTSGIYLFIILFLYLCFNFNE